ncbi:hypothetical protein GCM10017744_009640 [Streptomyces antimycoticus]
MVAFHLGESGVRVVGAEQSVRAEELQQARDEGVDLGGHICLRGSGDDAHLAGERVRGARRHHAGGVGEQQARGGLAQLPPHVRVPCEPSAVLGHELGGQGERVVPRAQ